MQFELQKSVSIATLRIPLQPPSHSSPGSVMPLPQSPSDLQSALQASPSIVLPSSHTVPRCGDTIVNTAAREECDGGPTSEPGVAQETAECNANCKKSECGDGIVNRTDLEECDDGPLNSDDGDCLTTCYVNDCGDGHVNESLDRFGQVKEECDKGDDNSDTGKCLRDCHVNVCGDGHQNLTTGGDGRPVEGCDSGPQDATRNEYCLYGLQSCFLCSECQVVVGRAGYCGDRTRQTMSSSPAFRVNEECDDGQNNGATLCDYGRQTCQICNADCSALVTRNGPYCGDGITQSAPPGNEVCDDGPNNGATECPYGQATCSYCNGECSRLVHRTGAYCGDSSPDDEEDCDSAAQFACGTCEKPATLRVSDSGELIDVSCTSVTTGIARAQGSITFPSHSLPGSYSGITVTLSDGQRQAVTFVFMNGTDVGDRVAVDISGAVSGADVAGLFVTALGNLGDGGPGITAAVETVDQGTEVTLTNTTRGVVGNVPVAIHPADTTVLAVTGMSGGVGCAVGQQCVSEQDCVSGQCQNNYCR